MTQPCFLLSLATAVPPHVITQEEAKDCGREAFAGKKQLFNRLSGVFDNAGIARRYIVAPQSWYLAKHGWEERNAVYLDSGEALFVNAAQRAIEASGLSPDQIDGVVSVSTTGIATPSIDARAALRMGLRQDVRRIPLFGLGCAGGVSGLAVASRLAAADPHSYWLFVAVETCSISIQLDSDDPAAVVATALFGDGCAAAVVSSAKESNIVIRASAEKLWPDTLRIMGWDIEDSGLAVVFDRAIPPFIESELRTAIDEMCSSMGTSSGEIDRICAHPGGVKVIEAIERALSLGEGSLDLERQILHDYGNMSAPTVLFVLERLLKQAIPDRTLMTAFGPGFTCASLLLEAR